MTITPLRSLLSASVLALLLPSPSAAQATRTWVSGVGDDANPCSRTAPCKTFAGAISKTADGGEISVLDPGGYGVVAITKSITIDGGGTHAGILSAGTNGVTVNAPGKRVALRNLSINGGGTGLTGIRVTAVSHLSIEGVFITGASDGIDFNPPGETFLVVKDTTVQVADEGLKLRPSFGTSFITVDRTSITGGVTGLFANAGFAVVSNSVIANHGAYGVYVEGTGVINIERSEINNNLIALMPAVASAIIRIADSAFYNNNTAFACGGGALVSAGNNRRGASPNTVATACNPALAIQIQ